MSDTPKVKVGAPAPTTIDLRAQRLDDEQFAVLQRTIAYGMVLMGTLAAGNKPTPTIANLKTLKAYADAVLEMVNDN